MGGAAARDGNRCRRRDRRSPCRPRTSRDGRASSKTRDETSAPTADIAALAQLACLLEVSAPKPGNVSPGRPFADLQYEDFLTSAIAIGQPFARAGDQPVGETIRQAIDASACWTKTNTNLGIVLLLAPLARAAVSSGGEEGGSAFDSAQAREDRLYESVGFEMRSEPCSLRQRSTMRVRCMRRFGSRRLAGSAALRSRSRRRTRCTLLEAMRLAADRDAVAREYATGFEMTFDLGAPALERARRDGLPWSEAVVETFLHLLAHAADTHIVRRTGLDAAQRASRLAREVLEAGGVRSPEGRQAIEAMDAALRDARNSNNPGTTADLTAAAIFVTLVLVAGSCSKNPHVLRATSYRLQASLLTATSHQLAEETWHLAASSASRSRKTIWFSPRRTSSRSPGTAARVCTATTTAPA